MEFDSQMVVGCRDGRVLLAVTTDGTALKVTLDLSPQHARAMALFIQQAADVAEAHPAASADTAEKSQADEGAQP